MLTRVKSGQVVRNNLFRNIFLVVHFQLSWFLTYVSAMNSIGRHLTQLDTPSVGTRIMMYQEEEEAYILLPALKLGLDDMWQLLSRIREVELWSCVKLKFSLISVLILHRSTNYLCAAKNLVIQLSHQYISKRTNLFSFRNFSLENLHKLYLEKEYFLHFLKFNCLMLLFV